MRWWVVVIGLVGCTGGETVVPHGSSDDGLAAGVVEFDTSFGTIVIEVDVAAPETSANFLAYVDAGFYDGTDGEGATVFHRVIPGFVIQAGGLLDDLSAKDTFPAIANESSLDRRNLRGTLSMARLDAPDSATSQFFINLVDNASLDADGPYAPGYAVFASVTAGMDVVDAIAAVNTSTAGQYQDVPVDPIPITEARRGPWPEALEGL